MKTSLSGTVGYLDQLTWLRGIAAFLVIISHSIRATEVAYNSDDEVSNSLLLSSLDLGSFGVILFFVLSGCTLYISNWNKVSRSEVMGFYVKRFFRIWPAFFVSLVIYILFGMLFPGFYVDPQGHWIESQFLSDYTFVDILKYLTLTFNFTGTSELFNNAYWSLPVEFQYYLIFPLVVFLLRVIGISGPVFFGVLLFLIAKTGIFEAESKTVFQLAYSFCGGVVLGYLYRRQAFRMRTDVGIAFLLVLLVLAIVITNGYLKLPDLPIISNVWNWYIGIGLVYVGVFLFVDFKLPPRFASFLKVYGTISYSTYLYHNLLIAVFVLILIQMEVHIGWLRIWSTFLFTLISSYFVAQLSYRFVEKPSIDFGKLLLRNTSVKGA